MINCIAFCMHQMKIGKHGIKCYYYIPAEVDTWWTGFHASKRCKELFEA